MSDSTNFRDDIDALIATGSPLAENQATPVVTNAKTVFEAIADKCVLLDGLCAALNSAKANKNEVFAKTDIDEVPTDDSTNLITSGGIAAALARIEPRSGVDTTKTVFVYDDGSRKVVDVTGALMRSDIPGYATVAEVYLGSTVTSISSEVFQLCENIKRIVGPSLTLVKSQALYHNTSLEEFVAPDLTNLVSSGDDRGSTFEDCTTIKEFNFPKLQTVATKAFAGCSSLERVYLPSCTSIGTDAFKNCSSLKEVNFGNELLAIPTATSAHDIFGGLELTGSFSVVVPDALYDSWSADPNWSSVTIVSWSDYQYLRKGELKPILAQYQRKDDDVVGRQVKMGTNSSGFEVTPNGNSNDVVRINFTPESIGMAAYEKLATITLRSRDNDMSIVSRTVCLQVIDATTLNTVCTSDVVVMSQPSTDYTFTFEEPAELVPGQSYFISFTDGNNTSIGVQLALRILSSNSDIYVEGHVTWRPIMNASWIVHATVESVRSLIAEASNDLSKYLGPIKELTIIGDEDYVLEDLKYRLDVIITTLKSITGKSRLSGLDDVEPIGDEDYNIDDVRSRLDTLISVLKSL